MKTSRAVAPCSRSTAPHPSPARRSFQIAWRCGPTADHALGRWWLARLQREDLYHVLTHKRRCARESMTSDELASVRQRSVLIRLHRLLNHPYRMVRRPLFRWLRRTGRVLSSGSN